jgi:hypothetical protein
MKGRTAGMLVAALVVAAADEHAYAQCAFDAPARAKGFKSSMVRTHASCPYITPSWELWPNVAASSGIVGCAPAHPVSPYQFAATGTCSIRFSQSTAAPCPDGSAPSCAVFDISLRCRGILDPGGSAPTNTSGWSLALLGRSTIDDTSNGDMTLIDIPLTIPLPAAVNGVIKTKLQLVDPCEFLGCGPHPSLASPPCTQFQLLGLSLHDPEGSSFAVLGSSVR